METTLSTKGQIVLPAELRRQDKLRPGDQFEIERLESGQYMLKRVEQKPNEGLLEWLMACPAKDWFKREDFGTTDQIESPFEVPRRRRRSKRTD